MFRTSIYLSVTLRGGNLITDMSVSMFCWTKRQQTVLFLDHIAVLSLSTYCCYHIC